MSEVAPRWWQAGLIALVVLLGATWLVPSVGGLELARDPGGEDEPVDAWEAELEELEPDAIVLVAFDPDVGTYPEIRATVRVALADLLARDARLAFVSLTPEGRALLLAELGRLERATANPARLIDLGFVPGAEAAIVALADGPSVPAEADGALARTLEAGGSDAVDAVLVVGGIDIGPRSWIEQYLPRVEPVPLLAVAPTFLLPDLLPYLETDLLDALLGTVADGATYRERVELGPLERLRETAELPPLGVLAGTLAALGVLLHAVATRVSGRVRRDAPGSGEPA